MIKPWELHPMLVHFPIAFLLGATGGFLLNKRKMNSQLNQVATGMLVLGVIAGWLSAIAGGLAWLTVPAHTERGHILMYWHIGVAIFMLLLFTAIARHCFRNRAKFPSEKTMFLLVVASALLIITGDLGGTLVFREGVGIDPVILAPEIRYGHKHLNEQSTGLTGIQPKDDSAHSHGH